MDNSGFSPNQRRQVEEDGTSAPLRLFPSTYTQSSLLKEINGALQKLKLFINITTNNEQDMEYSFSRRDILKEHQL